VANVTTLATVASILAGFGCVILVFRIKHELAQREPLGTPRIPWADRLLILATLVALLLVLLPLVISSNRPGKMAELPAAACAAAIVLIAGYLVAILARYRWILGRGRSGPLAHPEPAERWLVVAFLVLAVAAFAFVLLRYPAPVEL
jgi:amino acid transporter